MLSLLLAAFAYAESIQFQIQTVNGKCASLYKSPFTNTTVFVVAAGNAKETQAQCEMNIFTYDSTNKTISTPGKYFQGSIVDTPGYLSRGDQGLVGISSEPVSGWNIDLKENTISLDDLYLTLSPGALAFQPKKESLFLEVIGEETKIPTDEESIQFQLQVDMEPGTRCPALFIRDTETFFSFSANTRQDEPLICNAFTLTYYPASGIITSKGIAFYDNLTKPGVLGLDSINRLTLGPKPLRGSRWNLDFEKNTWTFTRGGETLSVTSGFGLLEIGSGDLKAKLVKL